MILFLKKKFKQFNHYFLKFDNYLIIFLFFSITIFGSLYFSYVFALRFEQIVVNNAIILKEIPFNHGNLINNLLVNSEYKVTDRYGGLDLFLDRLPALSFISIAISKISLNIYIFLLIKNIIFFGLFFFISRNYWNSYSKNSYVLILISFAIFFNFYNFQTSLNFTYADSYISILLPCLYLVLLKDVNHKSAPTVSLLLIFLFFLKTTMLYVVIVLSIIFLIERKKEVFKEKAYLPLISLISCMIIWGCFGYIKTGKIPFLHHTLSTNQQALALVYNKKFNDIYPHIIVDQIYAEIVDAEIIDKGLPRYENEWEVNDYFKKRNIEYFKENKIEIIKGTIKKINFLFFYVKWDNKIYLSHILNRIIFFISLVILVYKFFNKKLIFKDSYFFIILVTFLFPYMVGWITHKHLPPLYIVSYLYSLINIYELNFKKKYY